jgi:RNA polymerase sigma-70 factor (ECF subfamily)
MTNLQNSTIVDAPAAEAEPVHSPQSEDAGLVLQIRAGDETAWELVVRQNVGRMLAVARRFLRHEEDRADAVQEAFLSALRGLDTFAGQSSLATWLHRILVNVCLMRLRSQAHKYSQPIDDLLPLFDETGHHVRPVRAWTESAHLMLAREETRSQVRSCIDRLPEPYRTVLLLRDIEEWDTETTASHLGISEGAVKTRLHRARQALRALLEPLFQLG